MENVSRPIAVMRISIEDGEAANPIAVPKVGDGDCYIVEAAVPTKEFPPGMMPPGPDEGEGPIHLSDTNLLRCRHHASHGDPGGASKGVCLYLRDELGGVDLEDELVRDLRTPVEAEPVLLQKRVEGTREISQPPADGEVAPPAEAFMIKHAHTYDKFVHGSGCRVDGSESTDGSAFRVESSKSIGLYSEHHHEPFTMNCWP